MPRKPKNLTLTEDEVRQWHHRISSAEQRVKELRDESAKYRAAFGGKYPMPYPDEDEDAQVHVHRLHRVVTQWIASAYAQNPTIRLKPPWRAGAEQDKVDLNTAIYNMEIRRIKLEEPMQRAMQTAFLDGWGWLKTGFQPELVEEEISEQAILTDAETENEGFELGPQFFPSGVYLSENHAEHIDSHNLHRGNVFRKFREILLKIQEDQGKGLQVDQVIIKEAQRLQVMIDGIDDHLREHKEAMDKRDREGLFETNQRIRAESCYVDTPHNSNVVWDQNATGPHNWAWTAERIIAPVSVFQKYPKFAHLKDEIEPNFDGPMPGSKPSDEDMTSGTGVDSEALGARGQESDPDDLAFIWKAWDTSHRRVIYFHENVVDKPLLVERWPHRYLARPPHQMLYLEMNEDEFAPVPLVKYMWDQQLELNRYRTKAGIITRRDTRLAVADQRLSESDLTALVSANDCSFIQPENVAVPIDKAVVPVNWGPVGTDVYALSAQADSDIKEDTALGQVLSQNMKGQTATESRIHQGNIGVHFDRILRSVERTVIGVTEDLRALMRQWYRQGRYVKYFDGARDIDSTWTGEDLRDYDIEIELGSSRKQDDQIQRMQWMEFLKLVAPLAVPLRIDLKAVVDNILRNMGVHDVQSFYQDPMTPGGMAQQAIPQGTPGPGQGQNQRPMPGKEPGPPEAAQAQPAMDMTKP